MVSAPNGNMAAACGEISSAAWRSCDLLAAEGTDRKALFACATAASIFPLPRASSDLAIINEAVAKKAPVVEIIPGKGSGQLKKHVLRFLEQKEIKVLYHRVEKDSKNFGRVFVHFRWK